MNYGCGGLASPFPWYRAHRVVRVYVQVVLIVVTLIVGTTLGLDPILMLGWGTIAWLLAGRLVPSAEGTLTGSRTR